MNIDISDEMIEQIVEKEVKEKVASWFAQERHKNVIRDLARQAVLDKLRTEEYGLVIRQEATRLMSKDVMRGVCDRISEDIAQAFADKYGDY